VRKHCRCCWVTAASEAGCTLILPLDGDVSCMSGTEYQNEHCYSNALADHMIFWSFDQSDRAAAVELKSKNPSVNHVQAQLQNAAAVMEGLIDDWPHEVSFVASVLHKKMGPIAIKAIGGKKVRFRGRDYRIQPKSCGFELARLFTR
jgi:hypothetical protein